MLELGTVVSLPWGNDLARVIALDEEVVMYDVWWPHKGVWSLAKPPTKVAYYRLPRDLFEQSATVIRVEPCTSEEVALHRPDLPFSFAQYSGLSWYGNRLSEHDIEVALQKHPRSKHRVPVLEVASVFIEPFGPKDGTVPAVQINSRSCNGFTEAELLAAAWQVQAPQLRTEVRTQGIGVHRSGLRKRIPSYYLWGAQSRLAHTERQSAA